MVEIRSSLDFVWINFRGLSQRKFLSVLNELVKKRKMRGGLDKGTRALDQKWKKTKAGDVCVTWDAETSPHWPLLSPVHHSLLPSKEDVSTAERGHLRFRARTSHCALLSAVSRSTRDFVCSSWGILEKGAYHRNWLLYSGFQTRATMRNRAIVVVQYFESKTNEVNALS